MQIKKIKLFFELFINEIFEKTFVIFIFDQSLVKDPSKFYGFEGNDWSGIQADLT